MTPDPASGIVIGPAVRAIGLAKSFGAVTAVDDVTFDLAPGRIYGLLGPERLGQDHADPPPDGPDPGHRRPRRGPRGRHAVPGKPEPDRLHDPGGRGLHGPHRRRERALLRSDLRGPRRSCRGRGARRSSISPTAATRSPPPCRAASGGACRSPAPWSTPRRSCSWTSRRSGSTRSCGSSSGRTSGRWRMPGRPSSSRATSWTRRTDATSCCSSGRARSSPGARAGRSGPGPGRTTLSRRSSTSVATSR